MKEIASYLHLDWLALSIASGTAALFMIWNG